MESINIENNPVKTKNLNNLTSTQFSKLVQSIKNKKFRVVSWPGTVLMDLLEYAQTLVAREGSTHHSYLQTLQTIKQESSPSEIKAKIKPKTEQNNTNLNTNNYLLIGGLVLIGIAVLAIGYWLGKNKSKKWLKL